VNQGRYTVNEVENRTKVPASTLRQWERRYGFPKPQRSDSGYRLYCEGDVRSIELMKQRIAEGVSASRAAELVAQAETEVLPESLTGLQAGLLDALLSFDEAKADQVFSQAHSFHSVEAVFSELVPRTMAQIGLLWHQGEIPITTEHFASAYVQGRLRTLMSVTANAERGTRVIVACAPLERHELGALVLATLLRRSGYHVLYIGADTPVADLQELARSARPSGVLISATSAESVTRLKEARRHLAGMAPVVAFGGAAFNREPKLAAALHGVFLAADASSAVQRFGELVEQGRALDA